jgi:hypothetical protein
VTAEALARRSAVALQCLAEGAQVRGHAHTFARTAPPPKVKADKYWCDLEGNINVDHPAIPPDVKARELEKRRLRELEEKERGMR